ncbi:hypothetical protein CDL12_15480 [Handroanthus impetiginosus]|uniref:Uncharacterized protein n=1 Tax=Handroanthus impetiginosus TaxID=429701 RepID=A0A2G9H331_9LAMI|nr:hypothetical protein CDL12_15480 [Handroanthus impetiginosus]
MGCNHSCKILSEDPTVKTIRIIHLNGYIEELGYPVTVAEVTGKPPKHFLFTHIHLLSNCSLKPLKLDALLEAGRVYFMLPCSLLNSNASPADLAPIARKLASIAQNSRSKTKSGKQNLRSSSGGNSPVARSPLASPNRFFSDKNGNDAAPLETEKSSKSRFWKPVLSTIREISFNRRSESDLQEN